jgi:putative spermidine/putrescine transport system substrate-binding protein
MNRRSFLMAASMLALTHGLGLTGCGRPSQGSVRVRLLNRSVPVQLLREFQRRNDPAENLNFLSSEQLADLYDLLQRWQGAETAEEQRPTPIADLLTLGDVWLTPAIQQGLIQPLNLSQVDGWQPLADQEIWRTLVQRDQQGQPSPEGEIWAAPYRWGTIMIAYQAELFAEQGWILPTDWGDLWRPEFARRISLLDSPRSVIGLTLKKLGQSVNTADLAAVANLEPELAALHQQVKVYSSDAYLQPLILQDTALAVGWSTEILPLVRRDRRIAAVVPASGTILTADLWVQPASVPTLTSNDTTNEETNEETIERSTLLQQWLAFCWEPSIATQLSVLSSGISPIFFNSDRSQLPAALQESEQLLPSAKVLQQSEFLLPLPESAIDQYRRLWEAVRLGKSR